MAAKKGNDPISSCYTPSTHSRLAASTDWRSTKIFPLYLPYDLSLSSKQDPRWFTNTRKKRVTKKARRYCFLIMWLSTRAILDFRDVEVSPTESRRSQFFIMCDSWGTTASLETMTGIKEKPLFCCEMNHLKSEHMFIALRINCIYRHLSL
jgi:hypothetical protein